VPEQPATVGAAPFLCAHAAHPDGHLALALVAAQLDAQQAQRTGFVATLGLLYASDRYADQAEALLDDARQRWPGVVMVGTLAAGICASGVEYIDEPALCLMLTDLPVGQWQVFHGRQPLAATPARAALVHADPATPDLAELVAELSQRMAGGGYLFGGLSSSRGRCMQFADQAWEGGLSGVAFGPDVGLRSRVTQGCHPVGPSRTVTACDGHLVLSLDGEPALPALLGDLQISLDRLDEAVPSLHHTLVGLTDAGDTAQGRGGEFGADTRVRHLLGLDLNRQAVALGDRVETGMQLSFCQRHVEAARRDLLRICAELRDELEGDLPSERRAIRGAVYISCTGRGGPHFGAPSAEMQLVRQALGDVPLVGFFAAGEIARHHLYGYTGVLTVFTAPA
jgi:small ligand-binding sensory domain FIST